MFAILQGLKILFLNSTRLLGTGIFTKIYLRKKHFPEKQGSDFKFLSKAFKTTACLMFETLYIQAQSGLS